MDYQSQYRDLTIYYNALKKATKQNGAVPDTTLKWLRLVETTLFELQELAHMEKAYIQKSRTMNNLIEMVYSSAPNLE
ncbi:hypothetical protein HUZ36_17560 [Pseudoalteromonas sp. McH1-7]|uniref:Uncharacterized protein n=1 Tax=Pseudoalteromonas peptidolytica F12-50-A1 TaxID=1315280 RepID=A0A8I0T8D8_9GAMM|nr:MULTISPECIES: hypothetical protein [Pseudoalteromonas]MBE0349204.1 hypothetical protein [Pseudoalteromonas peptidolytica F12-50-A1]MDW7549015.1 hypothetical protein [Pseudoalteromonas peptidolytica]NLR16429.1 hypothetical protein [Pseudoalteromonas peptidolytica]NUZ12591.1 hypothetical protein [Pseudoalteromonas sp. McH1-7]RXF03358.1 hypothetical protein D9603_08305 [Pseudoalteromonas sp. PS5]